MPAMSSKLGYSKVHCLTCYLDEKVSNFYLSQKKKWNYRLCLASMDIDEDWRAHRESSPTVSTLGGSDTQEWGGEATDT